MAVDKSEPRTPLIVLIAGLVVVTLVTLKFVFDWYFLDIAEEHVHALVLDSKATIDERDEIRRGWEADLERDPMPIERAMEQIARRGRLATALIAPQPSTDRGALTGWSHARPEARRMRAIPPPAAPVPPPPAPPPAPEPVMPEGMPAGDVLGAPAAAPAAPPRPAPRPAAPFAAPQNGQPQTEGHP